MKSFLHYFMGVGSDPEFAIFTFAHLAPILVMLVLIFATYLGRDKLRAFKYESTIRYAMAFILIVSEMAYYWRLVGIPSLGPNPVENLPIAVCGWAAIFCSYMVIGKNQPLFDICYFWLLAGSIFAIITPTPLTYTGPTRFRYYQFWIEHTMGYVAVFYMIFAHKMRPTIRSGLRAYLALAVLAVIAYCANTIIGPGANYLFMARPEAAPSILDILPAHFGLRTTIMAVGILFLHAVAYLPWFLMDRKAKKSAV